MDDRYPLELLMNEDEQINPAILLAEDLMRRDAADLLSAEEINQAEEIMQVGREEIEIIHRQIAAFNRSAASPSIRTPVGF